MLLWLQKDPNLLKPSVFIPRRLVPWTAWEMVVGTVFIPRQLVPSAAREMVIGTIPLLTSFSTKDSHIVCWAGIFSVFPGHALSTTLIETAAAAGSTLTEKLA